MPHYERKERGELMATDQTREAIWQELLDSARLVRYYEALANRYRTRHQLTLFLLAGGATAGIVSLLARFPPTIQLFANAFIAVVAVWTLIAGYARKAAVLHTISSHLSMLNSSWERLWDHLDDTDDTEARQRRTELSGEMNEVTSRAGFADVSDDFRLNERSEEAAYRAVAGQYGAL